MDLVIIAGKLWRYRWLTLPVIVLTLVGAAYTVLIKAPQYGASSSFLLINPPSPPTADQIREDPELEHVRTDNPYTRFSDQSVVIEVLSRTLSSPSARAVLERKGADPHYTVESAVRFGASTPIVQVVGTGATPATATQTTQIVSNAVTSELDRMQAAQDVDPRYRITTLQLEAPSPQLEPSGQLRMLVGILVAGAIVLFIIVSVVDALGEISAERRAARADAAWTRDDLAIVDGGSAPAVDADDQVERDDAGAPVAPRRRRRSRL